MEFRERGLPNINEQLCAALGDAYVLDREIGRGGMARVFRAHDRKHDRWVAVKVLDPDVAHTFGAERFRREIRVAARLQHPHILPVFDSGEGDALLWFTMPLVVGESLRERLAREHQLAVSDAVRIAYELALALEYAHRQGVVHRDIKPENILLAEDGQTLLADFGIARAAVSAEASGTGVSLTATGSSVGTPAYMSPEQAAGDRDIDGRSDQYALGCVLYECLAGEPPFIGSTPQAMLAKRFAGPAPDVGILRDGISTGLRAALARALCRSPADRFPTTAAFAAAMAAASPVATSENAPIRRHRFLVVGVGLAVAGLALATAVFELRSRDVGPGSVSGAVVASGGGIPIAGRQRTFSGAAEEPSFSPDGRQIAYVETLCDSTSDGGCHVELRLQDVGSAQSVSLVSAKRIFHPFWTADGAWVLVLMEPTDGAFGTYIVPRLGGTPRRLGPGALVAFTATGDTILLATLAAPGAPRYLRRVRATTGETLDSVPLARELTDLEGLLPSPDGRWIVFRLADRLLLATPDRRVTDSLMFVNAGSLRWDPRGDALYAVVPGAGTASKLVRARVDGRQGRFAGGVVTVLDLGPSTSLTFDIAPDGRSLVHTGGTVTITLWAIDLDARPVIPRRLAASTSWIGRPDVSSDGQLIVYDATDHAGDNVYVTPFAGGPAQPVTHDTSGSYTSGWVAGSHRFTFSGREPRAPLYMQEFPNGTRRVIGKFDALPLGSGGTVELDAPGHRVVFHGADGTARAIALPDSLRGFVRLWDTDADGSGAYLFVPKVIAGAPERRRVFRLNRMTAELLMVVDLPGLQAPVPMAPQDLAAQNGAVMYATWQPGRDEGHPTVWRSRAGRPAEKVVELPLECAAYALTMSANGRRFACDEWTRKPDLFLIEGFDKYR